MVGPGLSLMGHFAFFGPLVATAQFLYFHCSGSLQRVGCCVSPRVGFSRRRCRTNHDSVLFAT